MTDAFRIELLHQGWLIPSEPDEDLCSHGHLRLTVGGVEVVGGHESYGISESALAMLRTLTADHTRQTSVADDDFDAEQYHRFWTEFDQIVAEAEHAV